MAISNLVNQTTPSVAKPKVTGTDLWNKLQIPKSRGLVSNQKIPGPVTVPQQKIASQPATPVSVGTQNRIYTAPGTSAGQQIQQTIPSTSTDTGGLVTAPQGSQTGVQGLFPSVVGSLQNRGTYVDPMTSESYKRAQDLAETLKQSRMNQARAESSQRLAPIPIGDATGRQAITRQQYLSEQEALTGQLQAEQSLAGLGIQQAGTQNTALGAAAGFAQPQLSAFGQGFYNPLDPTGGAAGAAGGGLNPINNVDAIARQVISGQLSPSQAYAMGGSVANWQTLLNQKILGASPNFNVAQAQARYDATQQAGTIAGVAPTQAAATAFSGAYQDYNTMRGQVQNVDGLGDLLLQVARAGAINPTDLTLGNKTIADLKRNLSTAEQTRFDSALSAFSGAASLLLASGSGQIPTDVSANIAKIANGTLSLPALTAMVEQAKIEGQVKLQTAASLVNTPGGTIGAPKVTAPQHSQPKTGTTSSGIRYTITP